MMSLSQTQQDVLGRLSTEEPKSAYQIYARLPTLRALVRLGHAKDVTEPGPGGMSSPTTHYKFIRVKETPHAD